MVTGISGGEGEVHEGEPFGALELGDGEGELGVAVVVLDEGDELGGVVGGRGKFGGPGAGAGIGRVGAEGVEGGSEGAIGEGPREGGGAAPPVVGVPEVGLAAVDDGMPGAAKGAWDVLAEGVGAVEVVGEDVEAGLKTEEGLGCDGSGQGGAGICQESGQLRGEVGVDAW